MIPMAATPRSDMATPTEGAEHSDGRRRRSQDSRARIVAAMLDMVHDGEMTPSAEQVAARAGVGLRTVFRHFKDMDSLYREMSRTIEAELQKAIDQPFVATTPSERIVELVHRRAAVYETITPFKRASDVHRQESRFLEADHARLVAMARDILRRELPPELARDRTTFEILDLLLSFESWNRLRRDQGLSVRHAREVLEAAVRRQLG